MILPGIVAGSIFTFSLTLGDFITPLLIGGSSSNFIGNAIYDSAINGGDLPFAAALAFVSIAIMRSISCSRAWPAPLTQYETLPIHSRWLRYLSALVVTFLLVRCSHRPLRIRQVQRAVTANSPLDTHWFVVAVQRSGGAQFSMAERETGCAATLIALVLGTLVAFGYTGSASSVVTPCHSCWSCQSPYRAS